MAKQTYTYVFSGKAWKIFVYPDQAHVHPENDIIRRVVLRMKRSNGTLDWEVVKKVLDREIAEETNEGPGALTRQGPFDAYWKASDFAKSATRTLKRDFIIQRDGDSWYVLPDQVSDHGHI